MPDEFVPMVGIVTDEDKRIAFANSPGRIFAIPDIHGRYDLLDVLLNRIMPKLDLVGGDKIIFMGDYIDRGPDSKEVVQCLMENQAFWGEKNFICLVGNHEDFMMKCCANPTHQNYLELWGWNGGDETLKSYGAMMPQAWGGRKPAPEMIDREHVKWIASLPTYHEEPGFFFSHAPVPRENSRGHLEKGQPFTRHELTWTYDKDEFGVSRNHGNGVTGVCGHVHKLSDGIMAPRFYDHYIFADAGCGCSSSAPLVAIEVKSRQVYYSWPKDLK